MYIYCFYYFTLSKNWNRNPWVSNDKKGRVENRISKINICIYIVFIILCCRKIEIGIDGYWIELAKLIFVYILFFIILCSWKIEIGIDGYWMIRKEKYERK